jgi:hypothetical protein
MLDHHNEQALSAVCGALATFFGLREFYPSLTVAFAVLLALFVAVFSWWLASEIKRRRRPRYARIHRRTKHLVRSFLVVAVVGALALFSVTAVYGTGVAAIDQPVREMTENRSVESFSAVGFGDGNMTVYVDTIQPSDLPQREMVEDAIEYWNGEGRTYAEREMAFEMVDNRANADIVVEYVPEMDCWDALAVGCAHINYEGEDKENVRSAEIEIETLHPVNQTRITVLHEFGHVVGLGHNDKPEWIMGGRIS